MSIYDRMCKALYETEEICLAELRTLAFHGIPDDENQCTTSSFGSLRALIWRLLLGVMSKNQQNWADELSAKRLVYEEYRGTFLSEMSELCPAGSSEQEIEAHQADRNLSNLIKKDVARTQAELHFFALDGEANNWMYNILFIYAKIFPEIGYIQGMNEVLAPIIYAYGIDKSLKWSKHTEADSFHSFKTIMKSLKVLFIKNPNINSEKTGVHTQMTRLVRLLRQHDAMLWQHLNSINLTPEYFCIRWYTTLLSREFFMPDTLRIWDSLLSDPNRFAFLHYVCCAILITQRDILLATDFCGCLKILNDLPTMNIEVLLDHAHNLRLIDRSTDQASKNIAKS